MTQKGDLEGPPFVLIGPNGRPLGRLLAVRLAKCIARYSLAGFAAETV